MIFLVCDHDIHLMHLYVHFDMCFQQSQLLLKKREQIHTALKVLHFYLFTAWEECLYLWVYVYLWKVQQNVVGVICLYRQQKKLFVSRFLFPCGFSDDDETVCRRTYMCSKP